MDIISNMSPEEVSALVASTMSKRMKGFIGEPPSSKEVQANLLKLVQDFSMKDSAIDAQSIEGIATLLAMEWLAPKTVEERVNPKEVVKRISDTALERTVSWFQGTSTGAATVLIAEHHKRIGTIIDWDWVWTSPTNAMMQILPKEPIKFLTVSFEVK